MPDTLVYLLLGGNMGNRQQNLHLARQLIHEQIAPIQQASPIYETAAWGVTGQQPYLNQVLGLRYSGTPGQLLAATQHIETELGRTRHIRWEPRLIDIDILFFGDRQIQLRNLEIPHPRLHLRRFTLVPLADIAPDFKHPTLQLTVKELLEQCTDPLPVTRAL